MKSSCRGEGRWAASCARSSPKEKPTKSAPSLQKPSCSTRQLRMRGNSSQKPRSCSCCFSSDPSACASQQALLLTLRYSAKKATTRSSSSSQVALKSGLVLVCRTVWRASCAKTVLTARSSAGGRASSAKCLVKRALKGLPCRWLQSATRTWRAISTTSLARQLKRRWCSLLKRSSSATSSLLRWTSSTQTTSFFPSSRSSFPIRSSSSPPSVLALVPGPTASRSSLFCSGWVRKSSSRERRMAVLLPLMRSPFHSTGRQFSQARALAYSQKRLRRVGMQSSVRRRSSRGAASSSTNSPSRYLAKLRANWKTLLRPVTELSLCMSPFTRSPSPSSCSEQKRQRSKPMPSLSLSRSPSPTLRANSSRHTRITRSISAWLNLPRASRSFSAVSGLAKRGSWAAMRLCLSTSSWLTQTTLQRVMVAGEVISRSGVSRMTLKLSCTLRRVPLASESSLESSSSVLKFSMVSDLSLQSSTSTQLRAGCSKLPRAMRSTTPCSHRPSTLSPRKYFSSRLFGLNTSTTRSCGSCCTYSPMSLLLQEVGPSTMMPVCGASRIIATLQLLCFSPNPRPKVSLTILAKQSLSSGSSLLQKVLQRASMMASSSWRVAVRTRRRLKMKNFMALRPKSYCARRLSWMERFLKRRAILRAQREEEAMARLQSMTSRIFSQSGTLTEMMRKQALRDSVSWARCRQMGFMVEKMPTPRRSRISFPMKLNTSLPCTTAPLMLLIWLATTDMISALSRLISSRHSQLPVQHSPDSSFCSVRTLTSLEQLKITQYLAMHRPSSFRLSVLPVPEGPCRSTPSPWRILARMEACALRMSAVLIMRLQSPWYSPPHWCSAPMVFMTTASRSQQQQRKERHLKSKTEATASRRSSSVKWRRKSWRVMQLALSCGLATEAAMFSWMSAACMARSTPFWKQLISTCLVNSTSSTVQTHIQGVPAYSCRSYLSSFSQPCRMARTMLLRVLRMASSRLLKTTSGSWCLQAQPRRARCSPPMPSTPYLRPSLSVSHPLMPSNMRKMVFSAPMPTSTSSSSSSCRKQKRWNLTRFFSRKCARVLERASNCLMWLLSSSRVFSLRFSVGLSSHLTFLMVLWRMAANFLASEGSCFSAYLLVRMGKRARNLSWWSMASWRRAASWLMLRRWWLHSLRAKAPYLWLMMLSRVVEYSSISRRSWSLSPKITISGYSSRYSPSSLMPFHHASYSRSCRWISCSLCDLKLTSSTCSRSAHSPCACTSPSVSSLLPRPTRRSRSNSCVSSSQSSLRSTGLCRSSTRQSELSRRGSCSSRCCARRQQSGSLLQRSALRRQPSYLRMSGSASTFITLAGKQSARSASCSLQMSQISSRDSNLTVSVSSLGMRVGFMSKKASSWLRCFSCWLSSPRRSPLSRQRLWRARGAGLGSQYSSWGAMASTRCTSSRRAPSTSFLQSRQLLSLVSLWFLDFMRSSFSSPFSSSSEADSTFFTRRYSSCSFSISARSAAQRRIFSSSSLHSAQTRMKSSAFLTTMRSTSRCFCMLERKASLFSLTLPGMVASTLSLYSLSEATICSLISSWLRQPRKKYSPSCILFWQAWMCCSTCSISSLSCSQPQAAKALLASCCWQCRWRARKGRARARRRCTVAATLSALASSWRMLSQQAVIEQMYSRRLVSLLPGCSASWGLTTFLTTQSNLGTRMILQLKFSTLVTNSRMSLLILARMVATEGSMAASPSLMTMRKLTSSLTTVASSIFSLSATQLGCCVSSSSRGRSTLLRQRAFLSSNLAASSWMWWMRQKAMACSCSNSRVSPSLQTSSSSFSMRIFFSKLMLRVSRLLSTLFISSKDSEMGSWNFSSTFTDTCSSLSSTRSLLPSISRATRPTHPELTCPPLSAMSSSARSSTRQARTRSLSRKRSFLSLNLFSTNLIMREPLCHLFMNLMARQYLKKGLARSLLKSSYSWMSLSRGVSSPSRTMPFLLTVMQWLPFCCSSHTSNSQMPITRMYRNSSLCDFCSIATIFGMFRISFRIRYVIVSLIGSLLSTFIVGSTFIDFIR